MKKVVFVIAALIPTLSFAQLADSTQRLVRLQGAVNFRDVGGYKTKDGKEVKWNKVFRSAAINKLTDEDMKKIQSKHIYTVVDFRGEKEAADAPDRLLPKADYTLSPAGSDEKTLSKENMILAMKQGNFLDDFYGSGGVRYFGDRYRPMFQKLLTLSDSTALLYHCTGGRDRTGMATALFLYTLGVPQKNIEEDFTASNIYLQSTMGKMLEPMAKASGMTTEEVKKKMELRPELIRIFFAAIREQYGSIESFMEKEMGIGKKEVAILKTKYTS